MGLLRMCGEICVNQPENLSIYGQTHPITLPRCAHARRGVIKNKAMKIHHKATVTFARSLLNVLTLPYSSKRYKEGNWVGGELSLLE